jgi:hypothetical protein
VLDLLHPVLDGSPQVEPKIESDLVVTGTSRMEATGVITNQLTETAFDGSVNVLVGVPKVEPPRMRLIEKVFESFLDPSHGIDVEQADLTEHGDMGE